MIQSYSLPPAKAGPNLAHSLFMPFPIVCFFLTLATDLAYWQTQAVLWETFSVWLLAVGLVMAGVTVVAWLIDLARGMRLRRVGQTPLRLLASVVVVLLSLINVFIHSRDGYTAVVPTGLTLSAIVVLLLLVTGWRGWASTSHTDFEVVR